MLLALAAVELALVGAYVATQADGSSRELIRLFDLDGEGNIPAWFSSMQLFAIAVAFAAAALNPHHVRAGWSGFLLLCGGGFGVLSVDEAAGLHEQLNRVLKRVDWWPRFPSGRGFWIFGYAALGCAMLALAWKSLARFYRQHARDALHVAAGIAVLVGGAFVIEVFGYEFVGSDGPHLWQIGQVSAEEFMEMLGASLVLVAVLRFAAKTAPAAALADEDPHPARALA